jgi:linoleoyl-CoA desaturase
LTVAKTTFGNRNKEFHAVLTERVDAYFTERGIERTANAEMVLKCTFWVAGSIGFWALAIFGGLPPLFGLLAAMTFGFFVVGIGFNIGHDAIHGAISKKPWLNTLLGFSFDTIGASSTMWALHHNIMHHTWTNVPKVDGDVELQPMILLYPIEKPPFFNRFQHLYAWVLYSFTSLFWVTANNALQCAKGDPRTGKKFPWTTWIGVALGFLAHATLFLVIPFVFSGYAWWQIGIGFVAMHMVGGFTLAVVFQLAHVVDGPEFPLADEDGVVEFNWAAHQMRTTANFAVQSPLNRFITGGLNQQIEHHLFPRICHIHYRDLAPIVKQTALEHGLPYYENPSFRAAVASHYRILRRNGRSSASEVGQPVPAMRALQTERRAA